MLCATGEIAAATVAQRDYANEINDGACRRRSIMESRRWAGASPGSREGCARLDPAPGRRDAAIRFRVTPFACRPGKNHRWLGGASPALGLRLLLSLSSYAYVAQVALLRGCG